MTTTQQRVSTFRESRRLAAVQTPVIPIVGRWIAETPGTISLGQGIVSYGPPPEAMESLQDISDVDLAITATVPSRASSRWSPRSRRS